MRSFKTTVLNKLGFHLRAVTEIVKLVSGHECEVMVARDDGVPRNGKSVLDLLQLEATQGTVLHIEASGRDEDRVAESLMALFAARFGED